MALRTGVAHGIPAGRGPSRAPSAKGQAARRPDTGTRKPASSRSRRAGRPRILDGSAARSNRRDAGARRASESVRPGPGGSISRPTARSEPSCGRVRARAGSATRRESLRDSKILCGSSARLRRNPGRQSPPRRPCLANRPGGVRRAETGAAADSGVGTRLRGPARSLAGVRSGSTRDRAGSLLTPPPRQANQGGTRSLAVAALTSRFKPLYRYFRAATAR